MRILLMIMLLFSYVQTACAGFDLEVVYPYNLDRKQQNIVEAGSTVPLYLNLTSYNLAQEEQARVELTLPQGFTPLTSAGWQVNEEGKLVTSWTLEPHYDRNFDLVYIRAEEDAPLGSHQLQLHINGATWQKQAQVDFSCIRGSGVVEEIKPVKHKRDKNKFNWYIQNIVLPVDNYGLRDERAAAGVVYVRDTALESFRNRMVGGGATSWSSVFNHPATFVLLEMRNPKKDVRVLRFKAELINKFTGEKVPGLCTAGKVSDDATGEGWGEVAESTEETTALISLDGTTTQNIVLPLYIDYFKVLEGDYSMRVTVSGNGQEKVQEVPLIIAKKHSLGLLAVGFAFFCLVLVVLTCGRIKRCIYGIGAKGAISVALFAALAFGGITLPTTILGDLLHVFLGPFSGLLTGVLSGVLQYLLIMALLTLYRAPGAVSLMYLIKFMLSCLMFGNFSPIGILSCSVYMVVLETALYMSGFYRQKELDKKMLFWVALVMGLADALITFVNLEQMMFFYRLYYADWYVALYMMINGVLYSSIGAWLGCKTGLKLRQVMGE